ncbi:MAG: type II secretion system GspH family protein [Patescibacteria group bacterium]|nr:type II secretion system GspH family protein [Patescibacteria group bacterium]
MINKNKGFTLIELLVVIAIIGILASIVLGALNQGRKKGNDAKVKSQLANLRSATSVYVDRDDTYAGLCAVASDDNSGLYSLLQTSSYPTATEIDCGDSQNEYSVAATLQGTPGNTAWCVDDKNTSRGTTVDGTPYTALTGSATAAHTTVGATQCN